MKRACEQCAKAVTREMTDLGRVWQATLSRRCWRREAHDERSAGFLEGNCRISQAQRPNGHPLGEGRRSPCPSSPPQQVGNGVRVRGRARCLVDESRKTARGKAFWSAAKMDALEISVACRYGPCGSLDRAHGVARDPAELIASLFRTGPGDDIPWHRGSSEPLAGR